MEHKKLVKILLKDMTDLEEMIAEIKTRSEYDALEMEILHTRAKGILQLLQLLDGMEPAGIVPEMPVQEKIETKIQKPKATKKDEPVAEEQPETEEIAQPSEVSEVKIQEKEQLENREEAEVKKEVFEEQPHVKEEPKIESEKTEKEEEPLEIDNSSDMELEEEEIAEANQRLGDSFLIGKSINDILNDQNKLEFKLSNRPVVNIQSAIGINDRFQYVRELFDGSSEKFAQTVADLDAMNNINEAVKYLQLNFKWKKNETSLKFVNLIKRRFPNA